MGDPGLPAGKRRDTGRGVDPRVIHGFHPGGEEPVEPAQVRHRFTLRCGQFNEELLPHGPKEALHFPSAFGPAGCGVNESDAQGGAGA